MGCTILVRSVSQARRCSHTQSPAAERLTQMYRTYPTEDAAVLLQAADMGVACPDRDERMATRNLYGAARVRHGAIPPLLP